MEEELVINGLLGLAGIGAAQFEEELGAVMRKNPGIAPAKAAQITAANTLRKAAINTTATRGQKMLLANLHRLPKEMQSRIASGQAKMEDLHLYIRKNIQQSTGGQELIDSSNQKKAGTTNIDGNKVETNLAALVTAIRVTSAASATVTDPSQVGYANTQAIGTGAANLPVSLANAELRIKKSESLVFSAPMSKFFNPGGTYASLPGAFDSYQLNNPILFDSTEPIGIEVKFADGATLPIANNFIQVEMLGVGIRG